MTRRIVSGGETREAEPRKARIGLVTLIITPETFLDSNSLADVFYTIVIPSFNNVGRWVALITSEPIGSSLMKF